MPGYKYNMQAPVSPAVRRALDLLPKAVLQDMVVAAIRYMGPKNFGITSGLERIRPEMIAEAAEPHLAARARAIKARKQEGMEQP